eukprot:m.76778 g.76778  ORF g.76778 m.76778 type:complete len:112 (+) comp12499_c0_seq1:2505-2840(+)
MACLSSNSSSWPRSYEMNKSELGAICFSVAMALPQTREDFSCASFVPSSLDTQGQTLPVNSIPNSCTLSHSPSFGQSTWTNPMNLGIQALDTFSLCDDRILAYSQTHTKQT